MWVWVGWDRWGRAMRKFHAHSTGSSNLYYTSLWLAVKMFLHESFIWKLMADFLHVPSELLAGEVSKGGTHRSSSAIPLDHSTWRPSINACCLDLWLHLNLFTGGFLTVESLQGLPQVAKTPTGDNGTNLVDWERALKMSQVKLPDTSRSGCEADLHSLPFLAESDIHSAVTHNTAIIDSYQGQCCFAVVYKSVHACACACVWAFMSLM